MNNRTYKYDILVISIIFIIIISILSLRTHDNGKLVKITIGHEEYGIYDLSKNQTINILNENILIIENNEIYMHQATCPDHTCIKQGHISATGASIICLPHQLIVEVIDGEEDEQDVKVY